DRLADVGVGLSPGLAVLLDDDAGEFIALLAHEVGGASEHGGAGAGGFIAPAREGGGGLRDHLRGLLRRAVVGDLRHDGALDRRGEGGADARARKVALRLGEEGAAVADALDGGRELVTLGGRQIGGSVLERPVARRSGLWPRASRLFEQLARIGVVEE